MPLPKVTGQEVVELDLESRASCLLIPMKFSWHRGEAN